MKLIVSRLEELRTYVSREFYYVMQDLIRDHSWQHIETVTLWNRPGPLRRRLLDAFGALPHTILFWDSFDFLKDHAYEIHLLETRKVVLADDLHWWSEPMRKDKLIGFALCGTVLSTCAYLWNKFYPEFVNSKKVVWIPHSASPDFMLDYNPQPKNAILLSGAVNQHYPLREQLKRLHDQRSYAISYHHHPGYHCGYDHEQDQNVGRGYAHKLNECRAGFTDSLTYGYVVAKYFEIPATGALLLADDAVSPQLQKLGFVEYEHYLPVSMENLEQRIRFVLDEANHVKLDEIRRKGQQLVWEKHKTSDRARMIDQACAA